MHLDLTLAAVICGADEYPEMYFSPELNAATDKLIAAANRNGIILSLFLFGTDRVGEFIDKGFNLIRSAATPRPPPPSPSPAPLRSARARPEPGCSRLAGASC